MADETSIDDLFAQLACAQEVKAKVGKAMQKSKKKEVDGIVIS